jgi:hypothetical protein
VNVICLIGISCGACARAKAAVGYAERPRFGVSLCEDQNAFLDVLIPCAYCVSTNVVGEGGRRLSNRSSRIGLGESRRPRLGSCPFQIPKRRIPAPHINFTVLARPCCSTLTSPHLTTPHHTSPHHTTPHFLGDISPISHNGHLSSNVRSPWSHLRAPPANDSPSTNLVIILYVPSHARFLATRI